MDRKKRNAERMAGTDPESAARSVLERYRSGEVTIHQLGLAAYLGDEASRSAINKVDEIKTPDAAYTQEVKEWTLDALEQGGPEGITAMMLGVVKDFEPAYQEVYVDLYGENDPVVPSLISDLEEFVQNPEEKKIEELLKRFREISKLTLTVQRDLDEISDTAIDQSAEGLVIKGILSSLKNLVGALEGNPTYYSAAFYDLNTATQRLRSTPVISAYPEWTKTIPTWNDPDDEENQVEELISKGLMARMKRAGMDWALKSDQE